MAKQKLAGAVLEGLNGGPPIIGQALRALRMCDEITLSVFAKKLGICVAHLCDIEKDRRAVSAERAARWAKRLRYPPQFFVQLALQSELDAAGIRLRVDVKAACRDLLAAGRPPDLLRPRRSFCGDCARSGAVVAALGPG